MANQKITELVDQKAFEQIERLKAELVGLIDIISKAANQPGVMTPQATQAIAQANKNIKEYTGALVALENSQKRANAANEQAPGSLRAMRAEMELTRRKLDEVNLETKEGAKQAEEYRRKISDLRKEIKANGDELSNQRANVGNYGSMWKNMGALIVAAGIAIYEASKQLIAFGKESFIAYEASLKEEKLLLNALKGRKDLQEILIAQAKELSAVTGVDDEDIISIQRLAAAHDLSVERIEAVVKASLELSAVTGIDLKGAAEQLLATYEGKLGKTLPKLSEDFSNLSKEQLRNGEAVDLVNEKYKGFSESAATSTAKLAVAWENFKESFGAFLERIGTGKLIGTWIDVLTNGLKNANDEYKKLQKTAYETMSIEELNAALTAERNLTGSATTKKDIERHWTNIALIKEEIALREKLAKDEKEKDAVRAKGDAEADKAEEKTAKTAEKKTKERAKEMTDNRDIMKSYESKVAYEEAILKLKEEQNKQARFAAFQAEEAAFDPESLAFMSDDMLKEEFDNLDKEKKRIEERNKMIAASANAALDIYRTLSDAKFASDKAALDNEMAQLQAQYDKKLISEAQYQKQREVLEQRDRKLKHDKAVRDKEIALFQAAINIAVAITESLKTPWMTAIVAAIGAAQMAAIIAQPIPKYEKGRKGGRAEWAEVHPGEIVTSGGSAYFTPDTPALTYLPQGASVIPRPEVELLKQMAFSGLTVNEKGKAGIDLTKLIESNQRGDDAIVQAVKSIKTEKEVKIKGLYDSMAWNAYVDQNFRR